MSATIDERIVEMKFDNKDFEKNASQSMTTLEKLQNALKFTDSDKSLKNLSNATKSFDLSSMSNAIDLINNRFSTMGIIGMTVISRLTNAAIDMGKKIVTAIPHQIMTGGWSRATNVEQAKFQLEGLKIAWEEISEDIDYAVKDTAYGADEASKAASMLAASGVNFRNATKNAKGDTEVYSDMGRALRGISGVAAMTNSSYTEMANIFGTVAGQGKLMTQQMRMLESRGLNVAAQMGEVWHKTEAEVRDMVSKGKVSFQMFADAMYDAFGEQATKANETFSGSMANMKAALSRIGQDYISTVLQQTPQVFNAIKGYFNKIRTFTKPFAENIFGPIFTQNMQLIAAIIQHASEAIPDISKNSAAMEKFTKVSEYLGRILRGIINLLYDFVTALKPIGSAFKEVFGSIFSGEALHKMDLFSWNFEKFTEKLMMSTETADKVKRTFKGIFAIFDILKQAIVAVIHAILPATSSIGELANSFIGATASIGDNIVAFDEWIKSTKLFENFASKLANFIAPVFNTIKGLFLGIFGIFKDFSGIKFDGLTTASEKMNAVFEPMQKRLHAFGEYLGKLKPLFSAIGNVIKSVLVSAFKAVKSVLDNFIDGASFQSLIEILNGVAISVATGGIMLSLERFTKFFHSIPQKLMSPITSFTALLIETKNTLLVWQGELKADILQKIAIAIGILAASLWVLSSIDSSKLIAATAAIGGLATVLIGAFAAFQKFTSINLKGLGFIDSIKSLASGFVDALKMNMVAKQMLTFAAAIGILSLSLMIISTIPTDKLVSSLIAVIALVASLAGVMIAFSKFGSNVKMSFLALIGMATAVGILAGALKKVADIDKNDLLKAILAIGALMIALTSCMLLMSNFSKAKSTFGDAAAILAVALALKVITDTVVKFSEMDTGKLAKGLIAVGAALLAIGVSISMIGNSGSIGAALSILAIAAALKIISGIIEDFANIKFTSLVKSILAFTAALFAMVAAATFLSALGPLVIVGSAAMVLLAAAMAILTISIVALSKIKFSSLVKAILGMVVGLAALGALGSILGVLSPFLLLGSVALAAFSKSLIIFAAAIGAFSLLSVMQILGVMGELALVTAILIPLSLVLAKLSPYLIAAGISFAAFGISLIVFSAGITLAAAAVGSLIVVIKGIIDALPEILVLVGKIIGGICAVILEYVPVIVETVVVVIIQILQSIADHIQDFIVVICEVIEGIILGIKDGLPKIIDAALELAIGFIEGLADGLIKYTHKVIEAVNKLVYAIANAIGQVLADIPELGKQIVKGFCDGLGLNGDMPAEAFKEILQSIFDVITGGLGTIWDLGVQFVDGFIGGIKSFFGAVYDVGCQLVNSCTGAVQKTQDSHSPSKVTMGLGKDFAAGYANGIKSGGRRAIEASRRLANDTIVELNKTTERATVIGKATANSLINSSEEATKAWVKNNKLMGESYDKTVKDIKKNGKELTDSLDDISEKHKELTDSIKDDPISDSLEKAKDAYEDLNKYTLKYNDSIEAWIDNNKLLGESYSKDVYEKEVEVNKQIIEDLSSQVALAEKLEIRKKDELNTNKQIIDDLSTQAALTEKLETREREYISEEEEAARKLFESTKAMAQNNKELKKRYGAINTLTKYKVKGSYMPEWMTELDKIEKRMYDRKWYEVGDLIFGDIPDWLNAKFGNTSKTFDKYANEISNSTNLMIGSNINQINSLNNTIKESGIEMDKYYNSVKTAALNSTRITTNATDAYMQQFKMMGDTYDYVGKSIVKNNKAIAYNLSTDSMRSEKAMVRFYNNMTEKGNTTVGMLYQFGKANGLSVEELTKAFGLTSDTTKALTEYTEATEKATDGTESFGKATGKAKNKLDDFKKSVESAVDKRFSGMTFFEKLELKAETSADSILENMRSNINGVQSWATKLAQVAERGLDKGLIQVLADAGIESYDQISAFLAMTDEQFAEANALYAQQAVVKEDIMNRLGTTFKNAGAGVAVGMAQGIKAETSEAKTAADEMCTEVDNAVHDSVLDYGSPSHKMREYGKWIDEGLVMGISFYAFRVIAQCLTLCNKIADIFEKNLGKERFVKIGAYMCEGLTEGIEDNGGKPIGKAAVLATSIATKMANALEVESPSKVTMWIGKMVDMGLAKGIEDNSKSVENASGNLANSTITPLREAMTEASDYIANNMDVNPTITPMLDLSNLMNQVDSIGGMFKDKEIALSSKFSGKSMNGESEEGEDGLTSKAPTYSFVQNNYSPKYLDRGEIYRRTNNQLSMLSAIRA